MKRKFLTGAAMMVILAVGLLTGRYSVIGCQRVPGSTTDARALTGLPIRFVQRCGPFDVFRAQTEDEGDVLFLLHVSEPTLWVRLPFACTLGDRFSATLGPHYYYMWKLDQGLTYVAANRKGKVGEQLQDMDGDGMFDFFTDQSNHTWKRVGGGATDWERKGD